MGKRQRRIAGKILEIKLKDASYCYGLITSYGVVFFDLQVSSPLEQFTSLAEQKVAFSLEVYNQVITKGCWPIVGSMEVPKRLEVSAPHFIQDALNPDRFELYYPNTGQIIPSTKEQCEGLEPAAVWEQHHVEERLQDYFQGKPNRWLEQLKIT